MASIAYLGPEGSFAHQAVSTVAGYGDPVPAASVGHALDLVRQGEVDYCLVPFENSVEGAVAATLDGLADLSRPNLHIRAEVLLPVEFVLGGRTGAALADVRRVATHPHAEAQCRQWLARSLPGVEVVLESSTSSAARSVAEGIYDAAVCAPIAADRYGLAVLATDLADSESAVTRFVVLGRPGPPPPFTGVDCTTVVLFERGDEPGALLQMLTEFAVRGVNLTRLESRPTGAGLGRYCFSIDCEGHVGELRVGEALAALHRICADVRFLGSYPRAAGDRATVRHGTSDAAFADGLAWLEALRRGEDV